MSTFASRLSEARAAAGLTQTELAERISAAQSTVATWERGKNEPNLAQILRLGRVLHKSPEWLAFAIDAADLADLSLIPEIDINAVSSSMELMVDGGGGGALKVISRYGFPSKDFRSLFGAHSERTVMVEVKGDAMAPTLMPGEKILVDTHDRNPSPPGLFVVWDGFGHVVQRIQFIPHSTPPRVRISSDNTRYEAYERPLDEAFIEGRVVGSWQRR